MIMLKIHDWEDWQTHRKDRGAPPWIKVQTKLLRSPKWWVLSDAQKGHILSLWLLGTDSHGEIPADPVHVQRVCNLQSAPDLKLFVDIGFLDAPDGWQPDGNHPTTTCLSSGCSEEREERDIGQTCANENAQCKNPKTTKLDTSDASRIEAESRFDDFWSAYPKKVNKKRAKTAFLNLTKTNQAKAAADIKSGRFSGADLRFVPHATTYLHGERWNDEAAGGKEAPGQEAWRFDL